ncbi:DUF4912 domain-containing protein [bacterium]|nr:DUF4912 domain-containing protein [bacterium]
MNRAQLLGKTKAELLALARRLGLRAISTLRKGALVDRIARARAQRARSRERTSAKPAGGEPAKLTAETKRRAVRKRAIAAAGGSRSGRRPKPTRRQSARAKGRRKSGTGSRRAAAAKSAIGLAVPPVHAAVGQQRAGLPKAYGTGRLFLAARDPGWLLAQWDLTDRQWAEHRRQAVDGRLLLRLFERNQAEPLQQIVLTAGARSWYLPVRKPASGYRAQLGYRRRDGGFHVISTSREAVTPAGGVAPPGGANFVTLPVEVPLRQVLHYVRRRAPAGEQLAHTLTRLHAEGHSLPFKVVLDVGAWSDERAAALLLALLGEATRSTAGSAEIGELLRGRSASAALIRPPKRRRRGGRS